MAGHSKWANIKHRKGAQDQKRSKNFQKLSNEIMVAIKEKGNNPDTNYKLRYAIEKAKSQNLPGDNIKNLLSKFDDKNFKLEEVIYEAYGPGGSALIINCLTDNVNRTVSKVKHALLINGGKLGIKGSVDYLFSLTGRIIIPSNSIDDTLAKIINFDIRNIEDFVEDDIKKVIIESDPRIIWDIKKMLEFDEGTKVESIEILKIPFDYISLEEEKTMKLYKLIDALEDLDDVKDVYTNVE